MITMTLGPPRMLPVLFAVLAFAISATSAEANPFNVSNDASQAGDGEALRFAVLPVITVPANILLTETGPLGAVATFSASATDSHGMAVPVTLNPASGSTFPLGTTVVTASAIDAADNTASAQFTVTVNLPVTTSGLLFSRVTHTYSGTITLLNNNANPMTGPLFVVLTNLTPGVTLTNGSITLFDAPAVRVLDGAGTLSPGDSVTAPVVFSDPANARVTFTPITVAASFPVTTSGLLFSRVTHTYNGTITLLNSKANTITGPLFVVLANLTPGVTLTNSAATIFGAPAVQVLDGASTLNPGDSVTSPAVFSDPANARITFTPIEEPQQ